MILVRSHSLGGRTAWLSIAVCVGVLLSIWVPVIDATGQATDPSLEPVTTARSSFRAAVLSLVLPGLGQHYVNNGSWKGSATVFALADIATWVGLARTRGARDQRIDSYRALAVSGANASVDNKDRTFFLNLATYRSSDEYLDTQLRNRAWDQLDYVASRDFQWQWSSEDAFIRFRGLRNDAETLDRRTSILVATLVANRVVSALVAVRSARRSDGTARAIVSLSPPTRGSTVPRFNLNVAF